MCCCYDGCDDIYFRHINEDKRKAEGHQVMFEILNDIENCPVLMAFYVDIDAL